MNTGLFSGMLFYINDNRFRWAACSGGGIQDLIFDLNDFHFRFYVSFHIIVFSIHGGRKKLILLLMILSPRICY